METGCGHKPRKVAGGHQELEEPVTGSPRELGEWGATHVLISDFCPTA